MSNMDLHDLRLQEFPHSVQLALNKLELFLQGNQTPQVAVLQQRIIDEFIFCPHNAIKHKSNPSKVLSSSINELIVVRILSERLAAVSSPSSRNGLVMALFHPSVIETAPVPPNPYTKNTPVTNPYARPPPPPMFGGTPGTNLYVRQSGNPYESSMNSYNMQGSLNNGANPYHSTASHNIVSSQYHKNGSVTENKIAHRLNILSALISLAVATNNTKVLEAVAVWMQQVCCLSGWSGQVCKRLIAEYCMNNDDDHVALHDITCSSSPVASADGRSKSNVSSHPLSMLPSLSPHFTSNLITCWAQLYNRFVSQRPPLPLLRLIVSWLHPAPATLLLAPLTSAPPNGMGVGGKVVTPVASLLRWCVEAPFFLQSGCSRTHCNDTETPISAFVNVKKTEPGSNITSSACLNSSTLDTLCHTKEEVAAAMECDNSVGSDRDEDDAFGKRATFKRVRASDAAHREERQLYCELQLCLLRALQAVPAVLPDAAHRQVLCCTQVITIVEGLTKLLEPTPLSTVHSHYHHLHHSPVSGGGAKQWRFGAAGGDGAGGATEVSLEGKMESVNRLAQVILVATNTSCLYGSHAELCTVLRRLPIYNRLVKILLTSHQGT